jgi:glycosyltransferase involved in cell wall biosynthesis
MIILAVHNSYQQPGGEDEVFRQETRLLERHGDQVIRCQAHNDEVNGKGRIELVAKTVFNSEAYRQIRLLIERTGPDVVHVHNTFPLLSPAVYYAARDKAVPVVQTLHNYRLLCPNGLLFRKGRICESCLGRLSLAPAIVHGCYRDSRPATAVASTMLLLHRGLNTYSELVTGYIALSEFVRSKYVAAGLPSNRVFLKPNFVDPDPGVGEEHDEFCLFIGRLSHEKGILTLLDAWTRFRPPFDLEIAGDGELAHNVAEAVDRCPRIRWHGRLQKAKMYERLRRAAAVIVPSAWYEPFGMVVIEAFAAGVPVIASKLGSLADLIRHGHNGLHFSAGAAADLAQQVAWLHEHPDAAQKMRRQARLDFENDYTGERNYALMMQIYATAIGDYGSAPCVPSGEWSAQLSFRDSH